MEPDTYRRRQATALVAGLVLIGLLVWAFTGGGGGAKPATAPAGSAQTYRLLPAAASVGAAATPASARLRAFGLPSPSPAPDASGSAPVGQLTLDGLCAPGTVVLSVFSTRPSYSSAQDPKFAVYAVSTAAGTCTFDLGPGTLHLAVMSSGRVIWDSGDCARSDSIWTARLSRGVPVLESITWNRTITLPGCVTLASSVRAGIYQAQASTALVTSAVLSFRLVP